MTPDGRAAEIKRLVNQLYDRAGEYAAHNPTLAVFDLSGETDAVVSKISDRLAGLVEDMQEDINAAEMDLAAATRDKNAAEDRAEVAEGRLTWEDERPIWYEAKGRIMEGQDPKTVLAWVLTWVSGEDILL